MAQPLSPEPPRPPEAPDRTVGPAAPEDSGNDGHPHIRLLQEPPERKATGLRPRPRLPRRPAADDSPLPTRGAGMTIFSYLIAGIVAYGAIGWLIGRPTHLPILAPAGMLVGLGISLALVIYRHGRSTPPRIRRFAPKPAVPDEPSEQNGQMRQHDQTTTMREELTGDR